MIGHSGLPAIVVEKSRINPAQSDFLLQPFVQNVVLQPPCSFAAQPVAGLAWAITMVVESVLFAMVLVKSRKKDQPEPLSLPTRFDLLGVLARDSKIYYAM